MDLQRNRQQTQKGQDFTLEINTKSFRKSETSLKKLIEQVNIELSNTKVNSENQMLEIRKFNSPMSENTTTEIRKS